MPKGKRGGNYNPTGKGGAKKGEVRNPYGRPVSELSFTEILRKQGEILALDEETGQKKTRLELLSNQYWRFALAGNPTLMIALAERLDPMKKVLELAIKADAGDDLSMMSVEDREKYLQVLIKNYVNNQKKSD